MTRLIAIAWLLLFASGAATFVDPDCWHLMALAREAMALGRLPLEDRFAYTGTVFPVVQHEWGSGFVLYWLARHGGILALQGARLALATALVAGAVRVARLRGATTASLLALAPAAIVMSWIGLTAIRPQVFTLAFLVLSLLAIEGDRAGRRGWIVTAILANLVWQNLHAGFVVGWGFLALHAFEQAARGRPVVHVLAGLVAMAALVIVNPYGLAYYPYLAHALSMPRPLISEWQPIWEAHPAGLAVYATSVMLAVVAVGRVGLRRAEGWPILLVAACLAARHERHVSIFALVWFAYVPAFIARVPVRGWGVPRSSVVRWAAAGTILAIALSVFVRQQPWRLAVPGTTADGAPAPYPVGPVDYLAELGTAANVLVPFVAGAYVSWKLHPRVKVSIDSRYEVAYPPERLDEHVAFHSAGPTWRSVLAAYPTDLVLVRSDTPIADLMAKRAAWRLVYQDDAYTLFARPGLELPARNRRHVLLLGRLP